MSDVNVFTHNLIRSVMSNYPDLVETMKNSDHNQIKDGFFSEWHIEGDVWTHTMMVVSHAVAYIRANPDTKRWRELIIAALFHDVGKPYTREWQSEKEKITFYGHNGTSTVISAEIVDKLELSHIDKIFVLELINYHQILFNVEPNTSKKVLDKLLEKFNNKYGSELLYYVNVLRQLDYAGNISLKDDNVAHDTVTELINKIDVCAHNSLNGNPTVHMIIGLPGSGKSTYINKQYPKLNVVSRDDIIMEFAGDLTYDEAWKAVDQSHIDQTFETRFRDAIGQGDDFIIDRTNLTYKSRMKFINRLNKKFNVHYIVLLPPVSVLAERNQKRNGKVIPAHVIDNMMKSFEMPFPTEADMITYLFDY